MSSVRSTNSSPRSATAPNGGSGSVAVASPEVPSPEPETRRRPPPESSLSSAAGDLAAPPDDREIETPSAPPPPREEDGRAKGRDRNDSAQDDRDASFQEFLKLCDGDGDGVEDRDASEEGPASGPPRCTISLENDDDDANDDVPLTHAQIAAPYEEMDRAMRDTAKGALLSCDDGDAPRSPSQVAASYEEMANEADLVEIGGVASVKAKARGDEKRTTAPGREASAEEDPTPSSGAPPARNHPAPSSSGVRRVVAATRAVIAARRLSSVLEYNGEDAAVGGSVKSTPPLLEATLVPEIPIYDAVQVSNAADETSENAEPDSWLKRHQRALVTMLVLVLVIALAATVAAMLASTGGGDGGTSSSDDMAPAGGVRRRRRT